ncbi:quinol oxidase [Streptococcus sp. 29896]|uniref:Quinol oxidase n=1 Tax=Streptococcus suivaginalis TaxID=3028082 RepID=A0AA96VC54_9STRE|nr:quinol oxidase [Streptococcus sp. 29896]WNY47065.1 quinol oxidase [Streptococcus sp. 29896]
MTEFIASHSEDSHLSRTERRKRASRAVEEPTDFNPKDYKVAVWLPLFWSLLLSLLSVANPFLTFLASNLQSQNLYAGVAMQAGQVPYSDFFGTSGILFYLLTYLGSFFQTSIGLALLQFFCLVIAGIYLHKILAYFARSREVANQLLSWFYLLIGALNIGGITAPLYALPFVLTSVWFLVRYFERAVKDESFILFGIDAALVFLIYPKATILWVVSQLVLLVFNTRHRQLARGIYQTLASIFGFLLVLYSVGYYTFIEQILGLAIQQTFLFNFDFSFQLQSSLYLAIFLLVSGIFRGIFQPLFLPNRASNAFIRVFVLLTMLLQTVFIVYNANGDWSQATVLVPYGLILIAMSLKKEEEREDFSYLGWSFYLPLLVVGFFIGQPVYQYITQDYVREERQEVARYIQENTSQSDLIFAWDDSALLYLDAQRFSSATVITAEPYLETELSKSTLVYDLNRTNAKYILVNKDIPVLEEVQATLDSSYSELDLNLTQFRLYEKNN